MNTERTYSRRSTARRNISNGEVKFDHGTAVLYPRDALVAVVAILSYCGTLYGHLVPSALCLGVTGLLYGCYIFIAHGGRRITAAGLFGLGFAVFVAGSSLFWTIDVGVHDREFVYAQLICLVSLWLMELFFWRKESNKSSLPRLDDRAYGALLTISILAMCALLVLMLLTGNVYVRRVGAGTATALLILLVLPRFGRGVSATGVVLASFVFLAFFEYFFNGFGRLVLVAMVLSVLVALSNSTSIRGLKAAVIIATIPAIAALVAVRENVGVETGQDIDGLGSMVNPFSSMVELLTQLSTRGSSSIDLDSFIAVLTLWVPRALWPDKPVSFGAVLVQLLRPELLHTNHSMAALFSAEWIYSLGMLGVLFSIVVLGVLIRGLDRVIARQAAKRVLSVWGFFVVASTAFIAGQMPTLVWSGLFSASSRSLQGIAGMFAIAITALIIVKAIDGSPNSNHDTAEYDQ